MGWIASYERRLLSELVQEIAKDVVIHYARVRESLPLGVKYGGGRLIQVIQLAQRHIFLNQRVQSGAFYQRTHLGHFGRRQRSGYGAVNVASLLPLFLIIEQCLFDDLKLSDMSRGAAVERGYLRMRVHGQREVAVNEIDFAGADVIVHYLAVRSREQRLAGGTLEIAEDLHDDQCILGADGDVGIDVRNSGR